ncbi:MAG: hypothetical protein J5930_02085 [Treponema sp.]|nr:hypothetical protein [Treponema sp.]
MKINMKKIAIFSFVAFIALSAAAAQKTVQGVALQKNTALWTEKAEGMMEWKTEIEPGTLLDVYMGTERDSQGNLLPETVTSSWTGAKKKDDTLVFAHVNYQGKDYYAISNRIAVGKSAAIVTKTAATYMSRSPADVRKTALKVGTIIAIGKQASFPGAEVYEMSYFDEGVYRLRSGYIKCEKVSTSEDDITALKIIKKAMDLKDEKRRNAMLESVNELNPSPTVSEYLSKLIEELEKAGDMLRDGTMEFVAASGYRIIYTADNSNVNVRDLPGTKGGSVISSLENGTAVCCSEYTVAKDTVEGITESWYYVASLTATGEEVGGWIFGGFTVPDEDAH